MPLKYQVESLDGVPEALQEHYTESNGAYVLSVDGVKPADEFQKVFGSLEKERNDHKSTLEKLKAFAGKTPADMLKLETRVMELEAAGGGELDDAKLQEILKQKLVPFEHKEKVATETIATLQAELGEMKAVAMNAKRKDSVISEIGDKVKPEFHKDLLYRAERELTFNEDLGTFVDDIGASASEWCARQLRDTPSWVVSSNGGGARGGGGAPNANNNPFVKGPAFSLTKQAELTRMDPKRAELLKQQAAAQG